MTIAQMFDSKTPRSKFSCASNDVGDRLVALQRTLPWIEMRNFDSNGMEEDMNGDIAAIKAEIVALDAERIAIINSPAFRQQADI